MKSNRPQKERKRWSFLKSFITGFIVCGAGIDLLNLLFEGLTGWALEQLLVKAVGSAVASLLSLIVKPIIKFIIKKNGGKTMNFFKKIGGFFKRVGQYLKSNKRTLGGIITSVLTGTMATTVCVCGYTFDLTEIIAQVKWFEWVKVLAINGFDLTPIIAGVIMWLMAIWNAFAAVSRGWESPETYAAEEEYDYDEDTDDLDDDSDDAFDEDGEAEQTTIVKTSNTTERTVTTKTEVAISSTLSAGSAKAVSDLDALIAKQKSDNK